MRPRLLPLLVLAAVVPTTASAAPIRPRVIGSATELGAWVLSGAVSMADDGVAPDVAAGDGIWTAQVTFADTGAGTPRTVTYKIIPEGAQLAQAVGQATGNDMRIDFPDGAAYTVEFRWADSGPAGFAPVPSLADSWNTGWSANPSLATGRTFVVAGGYQAHFGTGAWDPSSNVTTVADDGVGVDATADDGLASLAILSPVAFDPATQNEWKIALQGTGPNDWTTKLGSDGWSFAVDGGDSANWTLGANRWHPMRFEMDLARGMARAIEDDTLFGAPLLTELAQSPSSDEFIEIHNPSGALVSLDGIFVSDHQDYWTLPAATPSVPGASDFNAAFPIGAYIEPGGFRVVALGGATGFFAAYGQNPDFELNDVDAAVPDMIPATTGSIGSTASLTDGGEFVALYTWDIFAPAPADLVEDLDIVSYGAPSPANLPPDKTGLVAVTAAHGEDLGTVVTTVAPGLARVGLADGVARVSLCTEPCTVNGTASGHYNGVFDPLLGGRADETSEDLSASWVVPAARTPGAPNGTAVHSVAGHVEDDLGRPVDAAAVSMTDGTTTLTATADPNGDFTVTGALDGTWTLTTTKTDFLDGTAAATLAGADVVLASTIVMTFTGLVQWTLTGTVTDSAGGAPLGGVSVALIPGGQSTTTAGDGRYSLVAEAGTYTVAASLVGFGGETSIVTLDSDRIVDFSMTALPGAVSVAGRVQEAGTATPLEGATVTLTDPIGGTNLVASSAADGTFDFVTVPPNADYTLGVLLGGYLPHTETLTVVAVDVVGWVVDLDLDISTYSVSGIITDSSDGSAIVGANIAITAASISDTSASDGTFTLQNVPIGAHTISVGATGYLSTTLAVTVVDRDLIGLDASLVPGATGLTMAGRVTNFDDDLPIRGATIELTLPDATTLTVTTDSNGDYAFGSLVAGTYSITASAAGFDTDTRADVLVAADTVLDFALSPTATGLFVVSGTVSLSDQEPSDWAGSTVEAIDDNGDTLGTATTLADGTYRIPDVLAGRYELIASRSGYTTSSITVTISADTTQDFTLVPGVIVDPPGGCACDASRSGGAGWAWSMLALLFVRPRRRQ